MILALAIGSCMRTPHPNVAVYYVFAYIYNTFCLCAWYLHSKPPLEYCHKHSMELVGLHVCTLYSIIHGPVSPWQRGGIGQNFRTEESLRYRADLEEEARQKEEQRRAKDWKWPALLCKFSDGRFDQFVVYGGIRWPMLLCTYIFSSACAKYGYVETNAHVACTFVQYFSNNAWSTGDYRLKHDQKLQPEPFGIEFYKVLSQWI